MVLHNITYDNARICNIGIHNYLSIFEFKELLIHFIFPTECARMLKSWRSAQPLRVL